MLTMIKHGQGISHNIGRTANIWAPGKPTVRPPPACFDQSTTWHLSLRKELKLATLVPYDALRQVAIVDNLIFEVFCCFVCEDSLP